MNSSQRRKMITVSILLLPVMLYACGTPKPPGTPGFITRTSTASPTATCSPDITLSTPEGLQTSRQLIIFLFNPQSVGNQSLERSDGSKTQDVPAFLNRVIPKLIRAGDQLSGFHLGYTSFVAGRTSYEIARVTRINSNLVRPQIFNTPSPYQTITPQPTMAGTQKPGLAGIATLNAIKAQATLHSGTATAGKVVHDCEVLIWNSNAKFTATAWTETESVEVGGITTQMQQDFDDFEKTKIPAQPPLHSEELYDGLANATVDLADQSAGCKYYDKCILIIIGTLFTYPVERDNPKGLKIDLTGVNIYVVMPGCKDINQPTCKDLQDYWTGEFEKYGAGKPVYWNGTHLEENILKTLNNLGS